MDEKNIITKVRRFEPANKTQPEMKSYRIPYVPGMSVSDALYRVNENYGDALAHLVSCRLGMCGCCLVRVNGKPCLACCTPAADNISVEPAFPEMVIKDLVTRKGVVEK